jgi:hypothetical protein
MNQLERKLAVGVGVFALALAGIAGVRATVASVTGAECATPADLAAAELALRGIEASVASTSVEASHASAAAAALAAAQSTETQARNGLAEAKKAVSSADKALSRAEKTLASLREKVCSGSGRAKVCKTRGSDKEISAAQKEVSKAKAALSSARGSEEKARAVLGAAEQARAAAEKVAADAATAGSRLATLKARAAAARAEVDWAAAHPCSGESGALCGDGADNDGDGSIDCGDSGCGEEVACLCQSDVCASVSCPGYCDPGPAGVCDAAYCCGSGRYAGPGCGGAAVEVGFVSANEVRTNGAVPGDADRVEFQISFSVTAAGGDVFIDGDADRDGASGDGLAWGMTPDSTTGTGTVTAIVTAVDGFKASDSNASGNRYFKVADGSTRTFRFAAWVPAGTDNSAAGVMLSGIRWGTEPTDLLPNYKGLGEDFRTDTVTGLYIR